MAWCSHTYAYLLGLQDARSRVPQEHIPSASHSDIGVRQSLA
jgi:hypothetical protein